MSLTVIMVFMIIILPPLRPPVAQQRESSRQGFLPAPPDLELNPEVCSHMNMSEIHEPEGKLDLSYLYDLGHVN